MLATLYNTRKSKKYMLKRYTFFKRTLTAMVLFLCFIGLTSKVNAQSASLKIGPKILCLGQQTQFDVLYSGFASTDVKMNIIWFGNGDSTILDDKFIPPGGSVGQTYSYVYPSAGIYTVKHSTVLKSGVKFNSTQSATVYSLPLAEFLTKTVDNQCMGTNMNDFANISRQNPTKPSNPIKSNFWIFGDGSTLGSNDSIVHHHYDLYGSFQVSLQITDSLGCTSSQASGNRKKVNIARDVKALFSCTGTAACDTSKYTFQNQTNIPPNQIRWFRWYFGDGSTFFSSNPATQTELNLYMQTKFTHTYLKEGVFTPILVVADKQSSCSDSFALSMDPSKALPENVNIHIDIRMARTDALDGNDYRGDSVCLGQPDNSAVSIYNQYKFRFLSGTDITWTWNFQDPNQPSPPAMIFDNEVQPTYKYVAAGQYYPTLTLNCPGRPAITYTYYSRVDTVSHLEFVSGAPFNQTNAGSPPQNPIDLNSLNGIKSSKVMTDIPLYRNLYKNGVVVDSLSPLGFFTNNIADTSIKIPLSKFYGYGVNILGPSVAIENPTAGVVIESWQKNQCGPSVPVFYVNASTTYQSYHLYKRWDFADRWAPKCTSFSLPKYSAANNGLPPYTNANDLYNRTYGYFIANGNAYAGSTFECNFSHDTLPIHGYKNWDLIYNWHLYGHDFPPYDPARYTTGVANPPSTIHVMPWDTLEWNKPKLYGLTRVDTMQNIWPADLRGNTKLTINTPIPDPIAAALGYPFYRDEITGQVVYYTLPAGTKIDTSTIQTITEPRDTLPNGMLRRYYGAMKIPGVFNSDGTPMTLYRYVFNRVITQCYTNTLLMQDSINNASQAYENNPPDDTNIEQNIDDSTFLFKKDCKQTSTVQLPMMKADGWGLGKKGDECPHVTGQNVGFVYNFTESGKTSPYCGRTYVLFNYDSLFDRHDNTPCALDGFVSFDGKSPMTGGTPPGGYDFPPFWNVPLWQPNQNWTSAGGNINWTHYMATGSPFEHMGRLENQDKRGGFVTVGLIIGNGCDGTNCNSPDPNCITDTVWYHNFLQILQLDPDFTILPVTNGGKELCTNILREKGDPVTVVPTFPVQNYVKYDIWDWGDGMRTVDNFITGGDQTNPIPLARIRYQIDLSNPLSPDTVSIYNFKLGERVRRDTIIDTVWRCDDPLHAAKPQNVNVIYRIFDSAYMLMPLTHVYYKSSFDQMDPNSTAADGRRWDPTPIVHAIKAQNGCQNGIRKAVIIGIIDTFYVSDTVVCLGEEVKFTDYIRYWIPGDFYPDPAFSGNGGSVPGCGFRQDCQCDTVPVDPTKDPWVKTRWPEDRWRISSYTYPNDTLKAGFDPVTGQPRVYFYERVYWDWESDGVTDLNMVMVPTHKFDKPGLFKVSMYTMDSLGHWDTCSRNIYVLQPHADFDGRHGTLSFNCRDTVEFINKSVVNQGGCINPDGTPCDAVTNYYWWFGDIPKTEGNFKSILKNPIYDYRQNGIFYVKLKVKTFQGCEDTITKSIFLNGPRPRIRLLSDSVGCVPYIVRVLSEPDLDKRSAKDTATALTIVQSGNQRNDQARLLWSHPDTATFLYDRPGIYYLTAIGADDIDAGNASCPLRFYPDTAGGFMPPIRVYIDNPPHVDIDISKDRICAGEVFQVKNHSALDSTTRFRFDIWDSAYTTRVDSLLKTNFNSDTTFNYFINGRGVYHIVGNSIRFNRSLGMVSENSIKSCQREDTTTIVIKMPQADFSFKVDGDTGIYAFHNESNTFLSDEYRWVINDANANVLRTYNWVPANHQYFHLEDKDHVNFFEDWASKNITGAEGHYIVCLEARTLDPSCFDSVCKELSFRLTYDLNIPNVFTPGSDGHNDVFDIQIRNCDKYRLDIWNRWGTKVFESDNKDVKWNGKSYNTGSDCSEGTYYYVLTYNFRGQAERSIRGTITLIRP